MIRRNKCYLLSATPQEDTNSINRTPRPSALGLVPSWQFNCSAYALIPSLSSSAAEMVSVLGSSFAECGWDSKVLLFFYA